MTASPSSAPPAPTVYLVALDAREDAMHVLDVACGLGAALGGAAELHIVHVVPGPSANDVLGTSVMGAPVDYLRGGEILIERTAAHAAQSFRGKISGHLAAGEPATEIVQIVLVVRPKEHRSPPEAAKAVQIEPPCRDCLELRMRTGRASLWCERHRTHHAHGHLHYEYPQSFALGSMNFRP